MARLVITIGERLFHLNAKSKYHIVFSQKYGYCWSKYTR